LIKNTSPYALAGRNNKILSHMPEKKERSFDSLEKQLKSEKIHVYFDKSVRIVLPPWCRSLGWHDVNVILNAFANVIKFFEIKRIFEKIFKSIFFKKNRSESSTSH
jgi:hypothetical protein